jgi:hypothetical protein
VAKIVIRAAQVQVIRLPNWAERDRLQVEVDRLVKSIAAGVPADTVAPLIQANTDAIRRFEKKLRVPRAFLRMRHVTSPQILVCPEIG